MNNGLGRSATILIVEDVEWIRAGMKRVLGAYGYRVVEATDEVGAARLAESEAADLIMTEEQVPFFDALIEGIRGHPKLRNVPIVIVNPDAEEENAGYRGALVVTDYSLLEQLLVPPSQAAT
jgi:CheY-like chemotaxis protein